MKNTDKCRVKDAASASHVIHRRLWRVHVWLQGHIFSLSRCSFLAARGDDVEEGSATAGGIFDGNVFRGLVSCS